MVALALLLVGCRSGPPKDDTVWAPPQLPTSTVPAPTTTFLAGAQATPAPVASSGSPPVATTQPAASDADGPAGPTALDPARPGIYTYETSGVSTFGLTTLPYPSVTTLRVDPPAGSSQHWTRDLRDASGNGPVTEFALDFRPDGIVLDSLQLTNNFSGMVNVQALRPVTTAVLLPAGAGPGTRAAFDLQAPEGNLAHATVEITASEPVSVAGQSVDTLAVRTLVTLPAGQVSGTVELTGWFAPSARVWAKEHFVADASAAGGLIRFHSAYDATATGLAP